ncbi:MAG: hypothetical protein QM817_41205 [Archangium sp.]
MRRSLVIAASFVVLAFAPGCKTYCRQLSEKQCDCTNSSTERTSCLQVAATKEANPSIRLTQADEDTCQALLATCDCRLVDTPAGKERCGYAVSTGTDAGQ